MQGRVMGIMDGLRTVVWWRAVGEPPGNQLPEAFIQADLGFEAEHFAGLLRGGQPPWDGIHGALGLVVDGEIAVHHLHDRLCEIVEAGLGSTTHVEDVAGYIGSGCEQVGAGDVFHMNPVHGLESVAKDHGRLAGRDTFHPADQYLRVDPMDVHAWAIDVEVAQGDIVEPVHVVKAAQETLVEQLCGAVECLVVVRMVELSRGETIGQTVHRGGGRSHYLFDARCYGGFEYIKRAGREHVDRQPWLVSALSYADRGLVEDDVGVSHQLRQQAHVADVPFHYVDKPAGECLG